MKPRIGITSGLGNPDWAPDGASWRAYAAAVAAAGAEPVHLAADTRGREGALLDVLQGVLFSGGKDIDLRLYPNPPEYAPEPADAVMARFHMRPETDRDAYELPLLREALERDLPVLGICRGCQVLGVGLGGRLVLDIPLEVSAAQEHRSCPEPPNAGARHALRIHEGTLLAGILDPERFRWCNSRHHQSVRADEHLKLARVSAVAPEDGVVEAIEVPGRRWVVGVQWHPEHPRDPGVRETFAPLFDAFVWAAEAGK